MCIINIMCLLTLLRMCSRCVELCPREIVEREYNPSLIIAHPALAAVPIAIAGSNEPRNLQSGPPSRISWSQPLESKTRVVAGRSVSLV